MENNQYGNNETTKLTRELRTSISVKRNRVLVEKRRSRLFHNSERTRIKTIVSNIYETRETTVYKELPRRPISKEMDTIK